MYDSRTDHPRYPGSHTAGHALRHDFSRENKFVRYNVFGPTFRAAHQAPADDVEFVAPAPARVLRPGKTARDKARKAERVIDSFRVIYTDEFGNDYDENYVLIASAS